MPCPNRSFAAPFSDSQYALTAPNEKAQERQSPKFEEKGNDHIYFTVKKDDLYAIVMGKSAGTDVTISSLPQGGAAGSARAVAMLGSGQLRFKQDASGLVVSLPAGTQPHEAIVLKITGLKTNAETYTDSGNPSCECGRPE